MTLKNQIHSGPISFSSTVILAVALTMLSASSTAQTPQAKPTNSPRVIENYLKLPLSFEANRGQWESSVRFVAHSSGYSLALTNSEARLLFNHPSDCNPEGRISSPSAPCSDDSHPSLVRMKLAGSTLGHAIGEEPMPGKVNYFLGNDPARWHTGVPTYAKVRYSSVYPGVDLVYYGSQRQLEYDFVVAPGANPDPIRLTFAGADSLRLTDGGDLLLKTESGEAVFHHPAIYQQISGRRQPIPGHFRKISGNAIGFSLGSYDRTRPLIIDPVLTWSTYLGGSGTGGNGDQGNGIAVDSSGDAYVVGTTWSANFPLSAAPFQSTNNVALAGHGSTVFVSELNPAGTALLYSTYLGGSGSFNGGDFGYGIALDKNNNAYITGITYSIDFPVTCGAFFIDNRSKTKEAPSAFVAKLTQTGAGLAYSTFLGGNGNEATPPQGDIAQAIAVDANGDAFITGYTWSSNFPVTDLAFQTEFKGSATVSNGFVTELNPTGTQLVYSTFLGGSGANGAGDYANAIALDSSGDAFVAGSTSSADFPITGGTVQQTLKGTANAFVVELNPAGTDEVYATYLGGGASDSAQAIALDSLGFAYVTGNTTSSDFPLTEDALEGSTFPFIHDLANYGSLAFLARLNPEGSALEYSTYVEGHNTSVAGLAVDGKQNVYLTGTSTAVGAGEFSGFASTPDALPVPASGGTSAFLVEFNNVALKLKYATLLGGSSNDVGRALALDPLGNVYVTGASSSADFPATTGAFQTTNNGTGGARNAFVSQFALAAEANETEYPSLPPSGVPTSITINSEDMVPGDDWALLVGITLDSAIPGPPPTGTVTILYPGSFTEPTPVPGTWTGVSGQMSIWAYMAINGPDWGAQYSGDAIYLPSTVYGVATYPPCNPDCDGAGRSSQGILGKPSAAPNANSEPRAIQPSKPSISLAKYTPPPPRLSGIEQQSSDISLPTPQTIPPCLASAEPLLTVTLHPTARTYGAPNPATVVSYTGLKTGDTVTVTTQTTATVLSTIGTYPVTATVSGPDAINYTVEVKNTTLTVTKAPLYIVAANLPVTYGHTPPKPTAYTLTGFVNGDEARYTVTGSPILSTTVTNTTPVGFYPITVQVGTLSAANYNFATGGSGVGAVGVYKAILQIVAKNAVSTYGQTPPQPTAYTLIGFVNGDTSSVVSGAPVLTTSVTATTPVGFYKIGVAIGSLTAANYGFTTSGPGEGALGVYKAPLKVTATSLTMTEGSPVPTLTYAITGFVNGDTAVTAVTGAPVLTTPVTSSTGVGRYPIDIGLGTLAAGNYYFNDSNGVMTVLP